MIGLYGVREMEIMEEERLPVWSAEDSGPCEGCGPSVGCGHCECCERSETKTVVHLQGLWHPVAQIWLCRRAVQKGEPEFLLQLRSGEKDNFPNCWDVSVAGHVNAGESIAEGALRELKEELGIELAGADLHFLFRMPYYAHYDNGLHDCEWQHVYLACLDADFDSFRLQPSEVRAVRWVTLAQLRRDWADFALHYGEPGRPGFALHRHYPFESGPLQCLRPQKGQKEQQKPQNTGPKIPKTPIAPKPELGENYYWKQWLGALQSVL